MFFNRTKSRKGFTLIEVLIVVAIIGILTAILVVNYNEARKNSRDKVRKSDLKSLQLALELYKAQNGQYPAAGCGAPAWAGPGPHSASWGTSCDEYIVGLVPEYLPALPRDPNQENTDNVGYIYMSNGSSYKALVHRSVESARITSFDDEFSRCPRSGPNCPSVAANDTIYAVYSAGAEDW